MSEPTEGQGIRAYDLPVFANWPTPVVTPFRDFLAARGPSPRWIAPPVPEGCARVELDDDYYTGPYFDDWADVEAQYPAKYFDIPAAQRTRWEAARDAYTQMQEEIRVLRAERLSEPGWAPPGWVRKPPYQAQP